jgi:hypothetical protein
MTATGGLGLTKRVSDELRSSVAPEDDRHAE